MPASFPRLLLSVVQQRDVEPARLLKAASIVPSALDRADGHVLASEYAALIAHAVELTDDPCIGCELGLQMPATMHGFLGYALLSASTLGEALELGVKYTRLASRFVDVRAERCACGVVLRMGPLLPLGFAQQFAIESTMTGWYHTTEQLVGTRPGGSRAELRFTWSEPKAFPRYRQRLPTTRFERAASEVFVPEEELRRPLALAHPVAAQQARAHCDRELAQLLADEGSFIAKVAESLSLSKAGYPSMGQVAKRLRTSSRTLMRRLDNLGVGFRQLVEERRRIDAQQMLADPSLSVERIATRLGYQNPANFTRAFRRWTGETPSQHRARGRAS